ncbi:hypothetical protein [Isoptericola sp. NPDC060257]|uniref:hypothetical protein n=1 Tax=Isoptericola sp. NPDC060257 TaxID=3347087 RepID=UPI0036604C8E
MVNPRLEFALEQIKPADWRHFEKFTSEFLASDFPALRTTASSSGDRGRDAEVFRLDGMPRTMFQYSVTTDWQSKIQDTIKKITENFSGVNRIIYCTNQEIGAKIDQAREDAWNDHGIQIDLRDRNWFIERESDSPARSTAAEELIEAFVLPLLQKRKIVKQITSPLSHDESKVALLQLALNEQDSRSDQSLTKTSFDALVLAALVGTTAEDPRTKEEVAATTSSMLPNAERKQVHALASSALDRLSKKRGPVKHNRIQQNYHLSFEASTEWQSGAAEFLLEQESLEQDLAAALFGVSEELDDAPELLMAESKSLRVGLERLLLERGEAFAHSIIYENVSETPAVEIADALSGYELSLTIRTDQAAAAILTVLATPSERGRSHLERILNAYTLLAFLQQTPDVQKTLSRIFEGAEVWLDTSAVLPLIGELALDVDDQKPFTRLFRAALDSGLSLYVTGGVINEISHHLDNCIRCVQLGSGWRGRIPFVLSAYIYSGRSALELQEWIRDIKGDLHPEQDIEESIDELFGIRRQDLAPLSDAAPIELRGAVQNLWLDSHSKRRRTDAIGHGTVDKLVEHDVENVVGVIEHRRRQKSSPLGYTAWWLTLDRTATRLQSWLRDQLGEDAPHSPAVNPDYFSQMLRLGPLRCAGASVDAPRLPVSIEIRRFENVPAKLLEIARTTRLEYADYGERRIRREVRDALDRARTATGTAPRTLVAVDDELTEADATA